MIKTNSKEWQILVQKLIIEEGLKLGLNISQKQCDLFSRHLAELLQWNSKINLTALKEPVDLVEKHILDSIMALPWLTSSGSLLDIGSGGGFPGIPLKIMEASLSVTLIDATRKKVNFLKHVIRTLNLKRIKAIHIRAEELAGQPMDNSFDFIISRALWPLNIYVKNAVSLLADHGSIIAFLSAKDAAKHGFAGEKGSELVKINNEKFQIAKKEYYLRCFKEKRFVIRLRPVDIFQN